MKISQKGIDLIKQFEGFSPVMYKDSAGLPTIGYGTLIDEASEMYLMTATIDKMKAEQLLITDVARIEPRLALLIRSKVNQNQYDALCSFAYNLGTGSLRSSTLLKKVNINPSDDSIRTEFLKWVKVNGVTNKGLVNRRTQEAQVYFTA